MFGMQTTVSPTPPSAKNYGQTKKENAMKTKSQLLAALIPFGSLGGFSAFAAGAIAVDDAVGDEPGFGTSIGEDTQAEAAKAAMKECKKVGNSDCRVVVRFEKCGAYAHSKKYFGVGTGGTKAKARENALAECGNSACKILVAECE